MIYCATPYDIEQPFFYFDSLEEYEAGAEASAAEEFEMQFIDGTAIDCKLFNAMDVNQATLAQWFETVEPMAEHEKLQLLVLLDNGYSQEQALESYEDVSVFEGSPTDYAYDYVESTGMLHDVCETVASYFDFKSFGRDLVLGGDVWTTTINGTDYVVSL